MPKPTPEQLAEMEKQPWWPKEPEWRQPTPTVAEAPRREQQRSWKGRAKLAMATRRLASDSGLPASMREAARARLKELG